MRDTDGQEGMPVQVGESEKWLTAPLEVVSKLQGKLKNHLSSYLREPSACMPVAAEGGDPARVAVDYFSELLQSEKLLTKVCFQW